MNQKDTKDEKAAQTPNWEGGKGQCLICILHTKLSCSNSFMLVASINLNKQSQWLSLAIINIHLNFTDLLVGVDGGGIWNDTVLKNKQMSSAKWQKDTEGQVCYSNWEKIV